MAKPKQQTTIPRWTDEQVELLRKAVASAPSAKAAFDQVAKQLGKSPGTVQQKWYAMQRAGGSAVRRASAVTTSYTSAYSKGALARLDPGELAKLIENAREVLATKKSQIADQEKAELEAVKARFKAQREAVEAALKKA